MKTATTASVSRNDHDASTSAGSAADQERQSRTVRGLPQSRSTRSSPGHLDCTALVDRGDDGLCGHTHIGWLRMRRVGYN